MRTTPNNVPVITKASTNSAMCVGTLGIIAGEGKLPSILARSARKFAAHLVTLALSPESYAGCQPYSDAIYQIAPGQLGRNFKLLRQENVSQVVFIGKVPKLQLLRNIHKLDWMAIRELSKLPNFSDDTIQFAMGDLLESLDIKVLPQSDFLQHLFPDYGVKTASKPDAGEYADIDYGLTIAKEIARLDIGQTVIVKDQMVVAIEAIEGTDQSIARAVELAGRPVVVVKVAKPNQDPRFDVPAVGVSTLCAMVAKKPGGVLAVEAGKTMMVEEAEMIKFADEHKISIVAV
jgi:UDP-2,3-diacylglucosamine hydrolase